MTPPSGRIPTFWTCQLILAGGCCLILAGCSSLPQLSNFTVWQPVEKQTGERSKVDVDGHQVSSDFLERVKRIKSETGGDNSSTLSTPSQSPMANPTSTASSEPASSTLTPRDSTFPASRPMAQASLVEEASPAAAKSPATPEPEPGITTPRVTKTSLPVTTNITTDMPPGDSIIPAAKIKTVEESDAAVQSTERIKTATANPQPNPPATQSTEKQTPAPPTEESITSGRPELLGLAEGSGQLRRAIIKQGTRTRIIKPGDRILLNVDGEDVDFQVQEIRSDEVRLVHPSHKEMILR